MTVAEKVRERINMVADKEAKQKLRAQKQQEIFEGRQRTTTAFWRMQHQLSILRNAQIVAERVQAEREARELQLAKENMDAEGPIPDVRSAESGRDEQETGGKNNKRGRPPGTASWKKKKKTVALWSKLPHFPREAVKRYNWSKTGEYITNAKTDVEWLFWAMDTRLPKEVKRLNPRLTAVVELIRRKPELRGKLEKSFLSLLDYRAKMVSYRDLAPPLRSTRRKRATAVEPLAPPPADIMTFIRERKIADLRRNDHNGKH